MKYLNKAHEEFTNECLRKAGVGNGDVELERTALFYVLGLSENCRKRIDELYDFEERCIKVFFFIRDESCLLSDSDKSLIRLAFNLYNCGCPTVAAIADLSPEDRISTLLQIQQNELHRYSVAAIFVDIDYELREYCLEAIRICFI